MTELFQYTFFQNAIAGCILTGIVCGLIGTYIVACRKVFIAGGIAHASLGGVGLGIWLGFSPIVGASIFALITGCSVQTLSRRKEIREDSAIAMLWALGMSIGILCAFMTPKFLPDLSGYLFGNILFINHSDLYFLGALSIIIIGIFYIFMPKIVSVAFDPTFARSQGISVTRWGYVMATLTALAVVASLRTAGIVMVISLLSIPQMTANLITRDFSKIAILSVFLSIFCCLSGLMCSYLIGVPSGATIILVSIFIYAIVRTIKNIFGGFINR